MENKQKINYVVTNDATRRAITGRALAIVDLLKNYKDEEPQALSSQELGLQGVLLTVASFIDKEIKDIPSGQREAEKKRLLEMVTISVALFLRDL